MDTAVAEPEGQVGINAVNISLSKLTLTNFKGVKAFTLEPSSEGAVVRGDNGTGKTTLADAFTWLLFDKDSQGKKEFEIKTLDKSNKPVHNLEHTVEATLDVGGKSVVLKKVFKEKWTKKRGSTQADLTGHTTDHYIDEVPTSKREYEAEVKKLVEEETFKLLTSPTFFNGLHWEDRRKVLLSVCGDVADNDVIDSKPDLEDLKKILDGKSLADRKKIVSARKTTINKRLTEIPARIDERTNSLKDADGDPEYLSRQIDELDKDLTLIKAGGTASFDADILKLKNELDALVSERDKEREKKKAVIRREIGDLNAATDEIKRITESASSRIEDVEAKIYRQKEEMARYRDEFSEVDGKKADVNTSCPACEQDLPVEDVQAAVTKFNEQKAAKLRDIRTAGKAMAKTVEVLRSEIEKIKLEQGKSDRSIADISIKVERKQTDMDAVDATVIGEKVTIAKLKTDIKTLEENKKNHKAPDTSVIEEKLKDLRGRLARVEASASTKNRIKDLEEEEKDLAGEYEKLEQATKLMEQFIVAKVDMLEEKINGMFESVRFKLFSKNINGGIEETCQATYNGVPFSTGLNNGAKVAVGLDIVRTLQAHHKTLCPVFVDNRESVVALPDMQCQVISLVVDGSVNELTVNTN